jgi:2,3-diketo-5-methylthio-1-phosphopentane phosphatase
MKFHVLVDFDGTIATIDTTDRLLTRFADREWLAIEDEWRAGRIGSRECMVRQIALVRATPAELDSFIDEIEIDPGFPDFVRFCEERGHQLTVVSDGLDRTVGTVLARAGLSIPYKANHLEWAGADRWRLSFPFARTDCRALAGHCKCASLEIRPRLPSIIVGDGRSDFCMAPQADLVLAKGALAEHCRLNSIAHRPFDTFTTATKLLAEWFDEAAVVPLARGA